MNSMKRIALAFRDAYELFASNTKGSPRDYIQYLRIESKLKSDGLKTVSLMDDAAITSIHELASLSTRMNDEN